MVQKIKFEFNDKLTHQLKAIDSTVGLSDLHDEEIEDIANIMVSDIINPEDALSAENIEDIKNILNLMNN